jgi:hypothetical protein
MKLELPRGRFARLLLAGWALLIGGMFAAVLLAVLTPGAWDLSRPLLALSVFVMIGSLAYVAAFAFSRLRYYLRAWLRKDGGLTSKIRPIERALVAGWLLWIVAALAAVLFSQQKWVLAFGPEVLFGLFLVVSLSSSAYGSYLLLRQVAKHLRRD